MTGGPAPLPRAQAVQSWTSGAKDLVMTALGTSRVWATAGQGIVTEIYWPAVDRPGGPGPIRQRQQRRLPVPARPARLYPGRRRLRGRHRRLDRLQPQPVD